jgi:hypothetical protein
MLKKAFCDDTINKTKTIKWYSHCRCGQASVVGFGFSHFTEQNVEKV